MNMLLIVREFFVIFIPFVFCLKNHPDFDQLRLFIFTQALLADPLKPTGQSADPVSCNAKTLLSQLFDYIRRKFFLTTNLFFLFIIFIF